MCDGRPAGFESFTSGVGNLRSEMQSELHRKADSYEVSSLHSDVGRLEHTVRELGSENSQLRFEFQQLQERIQRLEESHHQHDEVTP